MTPICFFFIFFLSVSNSPRARATTNTTDAEYEARDSALRAPAAAAAAAQSRHTGTSSPRAEEVGIGGVLRGTSVGCGSVLLLRVPWQHADTGSLPLCRDPCRGDDHTRSFDRCRGLCCGSCHSRRSDRWVRDMPARHSSSRDGTSCETPDPSIDNPRAWPVQRPTFSRRSILQRLAVR